MQRQECSLLLQAMGHCKLHYRKVLAHLKSEARIRLEFLVMRKVHATPLKGRSRAVLLRL